MLSRWKATASVARGAVCRRHASRVTNGRSYGDAVEALNTLQTNFSIIDAIRKSGRGMNKRAIPEMIEWLRRIGYQPSDFNSLNAIHIAGTKGKGSTAAFVSSILAQYLRRVNPNGVLRKIGLYTSPHLRFVRERIQIDNAPISEEAFAKSYFEVWDRLEAAQKANPVAPDQACKPVYFRYLTLMALHTYLKEKVDTAVIECGIGGEHDSTNILIAPTVTGITSLGIDHTGLVGTAIGEIAWHKAGIMKTGASAFTSPQPAEAMKVLHDRAQEKRVDLKVVNIHPDIASGKIALGLEAEFQKVNASLAVELAAAHLRKLGHNDISTGSLPEEFCRGLKEVHWGGRCETRKEAGLTWHIDGGHTIESIRVAGAWFASLVGATSVKLKTAPRVLLFNQQTRNAVPLLEELYEIVSTALKTDSPFTHAVFCTNITFSNTGYKPDLVSVNVDKTAVEDLQVQKELALAWGATNHQNMDGNIFVVRTIEDAVAKCREIAKRWHANGAVSDDSEGKPRVLATGSIHLVGGVLDVLS